MNKLTKKEIRDFLKERGIKLSKKKYKHYFSNWNRISCLKDLPEDFIIKYKKRVNWELITLHNQVISDKFVYEHIDKLNVQYLLLVRRITQDRLNEVEFLRRKEIPRFELMEVKE